MRLARGWCPDVNDVTLAIWDPASGRTKGPPDLELQTQENAQVLSDPEVTVGFVVIPQTTRNSTFGLVCKGAYPELPVQLQFPNRSSHVNSCERRRPLRGCCPVTALAALASCVLRAYLYMPCYGPFRREIHNGICTRLS